MSAHASGLGSDAALTFAGPAYGASAEQELAEKYAPVVRLVEQEEDCGYGEPFEPTDVDAVLGNDGVALRGPWDRTNLIEVAPTAGDLASGKIGYHLDFPGDALGSGCEYERFALRATAETEPTAYPGFHTIAIPLVAIGTSYVFFDLRVRKRLEATELQPNVLPAESA